MSASTTRRAVLSGAGLALTGWSTARADAASDEADGQTRINALYRPLLSDPRSASIGPANADIILVEFFDYNCTYSMGVEPKVQALLKADPGVRLVLKEFPIEGYATSRVAARAALAAFAQGADKYAAFHQSMLSFHAKPLTEEDIFYRAEKAGLNLSRLRREMAQPVYYDQLLSHMNLARGLRVFQTPTFILDRRLITTPSAQVDFPALVTEARARRAATPAA